jgi:hypothetical protein
VRAAVALSARLKADRETPKPLKKCTFGKRRSGPVLLAQLLPKPLVIRLDAAPTRDPAMTSCAAAPAYRLDASADDELSGRVRRFFSLLNLAPLRRIRVQASGDTVIIEGTVRTFYERQVAIACAQRVAGVRHVIDNIRVSDDWPRSWGRSA